MTSRAPTYQELRCFAADCANLLCGDPPYPRQVGYLAVKARELGLINQEEPREEVGKPKPLTPSELATLTGAKWVLHNIVKPPNEQWSARLERAELKQDSMLATATGRGETPEEAMENYCFLVSGRRLVINAASADRREFLIPG